MTKNEKRVIATLRTRLDRRLAPREAAEHEAAHAVVALATGADVLMVHIGATFGGERLSGSDIDGVCALANVSDLGAVAVAGMVWDISDWLGPADASLMLRHLREKLKEPWPMRRPLEVAGLAWTAIGDASGILAKYGDAVRAVADTIESHDGTILDGAIIRKTVSRFMRLEELPAYPHQIWNLAILGIAEAEEEIAAVGLGGLLKLAQCIFTPSALLTAVATSMDAAAG